MIEKKKGSICDAVLEQETKNTRAQMSTSGWGREVKKVLLDLVVF